MEEKALPPGVGERVAFFESSANLVFLGAVAFLLGVFVASAGWNFLFVISIYFISIFIAIVFFRFPKTWALAFLVLLFFGAFYYHFYLNLRTNREVITFNEKIKFSGVVINEPVFTENAQYFRLKLEKPLSGKIQVVTSPSPKRRYGDYLALEGKIEPAEERHAFAAAVFPKIDPPVGGFEGGRGFWLKANLLNLKSLFINQFKAVLPPDSAALLAGLTFGSQEDFSSDLKGNMKRSGTTHLVALSGYNIGILVLAIASTLGYFLTRRLTFFTTTVVIAAFVLMVGAEASVVRAAIMGFLALFARNIGRIYSFRNPVTLTAAAMALFDPTIVRFNVGFELSFISLLGIVYLGPAIEQWLERLMRRRDPPQKGFLHWRENIVTTASAQLAVAPLLIQYFGQVSLTSLLANVLILGLVPLTMGLGFALALVNFILPAAGTILGWFVNLFLAYEIGVINFFSHWRLPVSGFVSLPILIMYYLALIGFILYQSERQKGPQHD